MPQVNGSTLVLELQDNQGSVSAASRARKERLEKGIQRDFIEHILAASVDDSHQVETSEPTLESAVPVEALAPNQRSQECQCNIMKNVPQLTAKVERLPRELARERRQAGIPPQEESKTTFVQVILSFKNESNVRINTVSNSHRTLCWTKFQHGYSAEDITTALILKHTSSKAFHYLRSKKLIALPGHPSLERYLQHFKCGGLLYSSLDLLDRMIDLEDSKANWLPVLRPRKEPVRACPPRDGRTSRGQTDRHTHAYILGFYIYTDCHVTEVLCVYKTSAFPTPTLLDRENFICYLSVCVSDQNQPPKSAAKILSMSCFRDNFQPARNCSGSLKATVVSFVAMALCQ